VKLVKDPFGNEVFIQQTVLEFGERLMRSENAFDDISTVIERPIMIFKTKDGTEFFYLRAIGWGKTMLIEVKKNNEHFEVMKYEINPPLQRIAELHLNAERLI